MARIPRPVVVDFETAAIEPRPDYPPEPCGVSIKRYGERAQYYAFGHAFGNNCRRDKAAAAVKRAWEHPDGVLCHNAKFDVDVAETFFGVDPLPWPRMHDTLFLLYLNDPRQENLGLKRSAELLLGLPPEERDALADWLVEHQPVEGVKISRAPNSPSYFMRYVYHVPGGLAGEYANGDAVRTEKLFRLLYKKVAARKMLDAYDRERRLMPVLLAMERQGIPVNAKRLERDVKKYQAFLKELNFWIVSRIGADPDINLDSGQQLVEAMIASGCADPDLLPRTAKTHKFQTNKEALVLGVTDKTLLAVLKYRTQLSTCLNTFMLPWLGTAKRSDGLIYTTWNQTRLPSGDSNVGTRTGRLSSTPNFQNIPKEFAPGFSHEAKLLGLDALARSLPRCPVKDLPPLPRVRGYVVPFKGEVLIDRDYSQQELRILAHFDGGSLLGRYRENNWIDFHDYTQLELRKMNLFYDRKPVKNTNFGLIYGMGVGKLAVKNNMTVEEATTLKKAILILYPGLDEMYREMRRRAKLGQPIRTWGGREYYCEEPSVTGGRIYEYDYKLVNVLIQGSAADCTKEALIRFAAQKPPGCRILLTAHDEILASSPRADAAQNMEIMRRTMESIEFDVPMLSEGSVSTVSWSELRDYDVKGELCRRSSSRAGRSAGTQITASAR